MHYALEGLERAVTTWEDFLLKSDLELLEEPVHSKEELPTAEAIQFLLKGEDQVSSPSFGIVNEYQTQAQGLIFHFDFYRLDDPMEALDIGIEEYFYSGNYCWLEWAENIAAFLPERFFLIELTLESETGRLLTLHHHQDGH